MKLNHINLPVDNVAESTAFLNNISILNASK